jgi:hypothetical protein
VRGKSGSLVTLGCGDIQSDSENARRPAISLHPLQRAKPRDVPKLRWPGVGCDGNSQSPLCRRTSKGPTEVLLAMISSAANMRTWSELELALRSKHSFAKAPRRPRRFAILQLAKEHAWRLI